LLEVNPPIAGVQKSSPEIRKPLRQKQIQTRPPARADGPERHAFVKLSKNWQVPTKTRSTATQRRQSSSLNDEMTQESGHLQEPRLARLGYASGDP
jgi:hypothetical protein